MKGRILTAIGILHVVRGVSTPIPCRSGETKCVNVSGCVRYHGIVTLNLYSDLHFLK